VQLTNGPLNFSAPMFSHDGAKLFALGLLPKGEVVRYDVKTQNFTTWAPSVSAGMLSFSGDGNWMAYVSFPGGVLWRARTDGSQKLQLTHSPLDVENPSWSHDANLVAFHAYAGTGRPKIYIISAKGGDPEQLLPEWPGEIDPQWAPDGKTILFGSTLNEALRPADHDAVNGASAEMLTLHMLDLRTRQVSPLPGSNGLFGPRWSPDGRYVTASKKYGPDQIFMMYDFRTGTWSELFRAVVHFRSWSHDGKHIYFDSMLIGTDHPAIFRFDLTDRHMVKIADLTDFPAARLPRLGGWFGLAPDDSPLLLRDISTHEIYALDWQPR
jgi:Tol biopolymer transport system component